MTETQANTMIELLQLLNGNAQAIVWALGVVCSFITFIGLFNVFKGKFL